LQSQLLVQQRVLQLVPLLAFLLVSKQQERQE
jgi:hypothetical protein